MNVSRFLDWKQAEARWETLLAAVERQIPADFVPADEAEPPIQHRRGAELEIAISQWQPGKNGLDLNAIGGERSATGREPRLVNLVSVRIRPQSPRTQAGRLRQWTALCKLRESIRQQLANVRQGMKDALSDALQETIVDPRIEGNPPKRGEAGVGATGLSAARGQ